MNQGSLFSGVGGFDLASEWMGWNNVFHCEINPFGKKILKYYWPNAISYDDITKTDFTIHRGTIDILTGGFPCQPFSLAGKRKGTADERHLWPEMLRAIREIQPRWIVGENVRGLISWNAGMVFDQVQTDLENEGYQVLPIILPACAVNAPHRRDRIWFVAYSNSNGHQLRGLGKDRSTQSQSISQQEQRERIWTDNRRISKQRTTTDTSNQGLQSSKLNGTFEQKKVRKQAHRPVTEFYKIENWGNFPTVEPTICSGNDGLSNQLDGITFPKWRNESIKAYGNAIVPQVAYQIFKAISEYENL